MIAVVAVYNVLGGHKMNEQISELRIANKELAYELAEKLSFGKTVSHVIEINNGSFLVIVELKPRYQTVICDDADLSGEQEEVYDDGTIFDDEKYLGESPIASLRKINGGKTPQELIMEALGQING